MLKNRHRIIRTIIVTGLAAALALVVLSLLGGCASSSTPSNDPAAVNRRFMAQINVSMEDLRVDLGSFNDAAAKSDLAGMEALGEKARRTIEGFEKLTPPDALKDIHAEYVAGCKDLEEALIGYIDLYAQMQAAKAQKEAAAAIGGGKADGSKESQSAAPDAGSDMAGTEAVGSTGATGATGEGATGASGEGAAGMIGAGSAGETASQGSGSTSSESTPAGSLSSQSTPSGSTSADSTLTDSAAFSKRLEELRKLYESGMKHLEEADRLAAAL